jgi:predicted RNA-binding protein with EMAP domain
MTHDTTNDPRIQVAQMACNLLKKAVKLKPGVSLRISRDKVTELAAKCDSAMMALTYAYQDPKTLSASDFMKTLLETLDLLNEAYAPLVEKKDDGTMLRANVRWCLRTLNGLKGRLANAGKTLSSGVDLVVVKVKNVERGENLLRTKVTDGTSDYTVVTNMMGVKNDDMLAVAFLPPREVGGTVSEAMFLGDQARAEEPGTLLDEDEVDAREAAAILYAQER